MNDEIKAIKRFGWCESVRGNTSDSMYGDPVQSSRRKKGNKQTHSH